MKAVRFAIVAVAIALALLCARVEAQLPGLLPAGDSLLGRDTTQGVFVRDSAVAVEKFTLARRMTDLREWEKAAETYETARQRVEEKINAARDAIEEKRTQVERAMEAGRQAAQEARADLERRLAETKAAYNAGAQVARDVRAERAAKAAGSVARTPNRAV